jgi:hypothetical protein
VPSDSFPSSVFARLFLEGRPDEVQSQIQRLRDGRSILDSVSEQAKAITPVLGKLDKSKLDEYFTSVRELERNLAIAEEWSRKPKPKVEAKQPVNIANGADVAGKARLMFDLTHLALQTDSSRLITMLLLGTSLVPPIPGVNLGHHDLSHHGKSEEKQAKLQKINLFHLQQLAYLADQLSAVDEAGESLLDRTMVIYGSGISDGDRHNHDDLPILMLGKAGGRLNKSGHWRYPNNTPLCNLYLWMLHQVGIKGDRFGDSSDLLRIG